ncbi:MAG: acetyltransferase [Candidatus Parcubacteria bacterium]|nr:MAG: acetyltransferase [Candidatus Parcubacteria bacterium]
MILSKKNKIARFIWNIAYYILFRPFPSKIFNPWRKFLLRLFGAKLKKGSGVYSSCKIWAPWNLVLEENAWLGPYVDCYNVALVKLGANATVSQKSYLCTASHDIYDKNHPLIASPIIIEQKAWVAADAFINMGVTIGKGAVVAARAVVVKDVEPWTVVGGNPAKFIKKREIKE